MGTVIAAPASCEVRAVIRFLHAEGQIAAALCPSAYEGMRVRVQQEQKFLVTTERAI